MIQKKYHFVTEFEGSRQFFSNAQEKVFMSIYHQHLQTIRSLTFFLVIVLTTSLKNVEVRFIYNHNGAYIKS